MENRTGESTRQEEPSSTPETTTPATADVADDPLQFFAEPPSYEASTSQPEGAVACPHGGPTTGGPLPGGPLPGGFQAPPLPQKPRNGGDAIPVIQQQSYNGVITNDMMANFAGLQGGTGSSKLDSTRKHQKVLKCTGIWQLVASGMLFVLAVIKHVHGFRLYGLFGYASAAAGLLAGIAAIMCSHKPNKRSIVTTICLSGLAIAGGITGLVGNSMAWRCPYVTWGGWCHRGHREARATVGLSLFAASMELAFGCGAMLIAAILLCRKESGSMNGTQSQGPAPVNFVLQVTPGPAQGQAVPPLEEADLRDCP